MIYALCMVAALWLGCTPEAADSGIVVDPNDMDGDGFSPGDGDCDDKDATSYPGAEERFYDGADQNCDGASDDDADGDGVEIDQDCNDVDAAVRPGATEVCDGIDNDCVEGIDFGAEGALLAYADADADGWGAGAQVAICADSVPAGYSAVVGDCDDSTPGIFPGGTEYCDSLDNDCDGSIDEESIDAGYVYADTDGDGYGTHTLYQHVCGVPAGWSADSTDCDDANAAVNPAATEVCDLADNDCDGVVDSLGECP